MNKPFRIGLIMQGDRSWIGGMEYIRSIVRALASLPQETRENIEVSLLCSRYTDRDFIESMQSCLQKVYVFDELIVRTLFNRAKWAFKRHLFRSPDYRYDVILKRCKFDFVYPCTSVYNGFSPKEAAAWIPDFQHKYLPGFFSDEEIEYREKLYSMLARKANQIVLSSRSAESDFKKFYPEASHKTEVLSFRTIPQPQWYAASPLEIQTKYFLPDKFFIISNQFWQHKNHLVVFDALRILKERGISPTVVCTGHIGDYRYPEYSDVILQTIHKSGLGQQVYLLGLIPKNDQIQLLRRSIAMIQPSLFEGWSTVIEDARCFGKPVILSDFPVHMEQNPPSARFFERTSPDKLAPIIADYWELFAPGPNLEHEATAREKNGKEIQEFAVNFLKIAQKMIPADQFA
jgi:glycosyltransferase involved in cell wall biosynthesis